MRDLDARYPWKGNRILINMGLTGGLIVMGMLSGLFTWWNLWCPFYSDRLRPTTQYVGFKNFNFPCQSSTCAWIHLPSAFSLLILILIFNMWLNFQSFPCSKPGNSPNDREICRVFPTDPPGEIHGRRRSWVPLCCSVPWLRWPTGRSV